jgi:hypothetical protein
VIETEAGARRDFTPDRSVVIEVFKMDPPVGEEPLMKIVDAVNGYAVVALESVTPGSLEAGGAINAEQYRRQIANAAASIEVTGMMSQLRDMGVVEVYEERLK